MKIPASYHQERLWFIDKFENGYLYESSPIYHNLPLILNIKGPLDIEILDKSIQDVINRHEALRTRIVTIEDKPYQWVNQTVNFSLSVFDLTRGGHTGGYDRAISCAFEEIKKPFVLHEGPLIRGKLIRFESREFILVITIHHIIADRYSINILLEEIFLYYKGYLKKQPLKLPDLSIHYADFSQWQRSLSEKFMESLLSYWKSKLSGKLQALELQLDRTRALVHTYQSKRQSISFPKGLCDRIKAFSKQEKTSNFITLLAAFKVLLYRYTGHDEIVVGINAQNRNQPGLEKTIGPISNLLVIRDYLSKELPSREFISEVDKTVKDAYKRQYMPFDKLALEINPAVDMSRTVFFDVLFQYEDTPHPIPPVEYLKITTVETNLGWGKYDLNILIQDKGESFSGILVYNSDIFNEATISRMIEHYLVLLKRILEDPAGAISSYTILTDREKNQLLTKWNQLQVHYPENKTLHELFAEQAARTPDNIAVKGPAFSEGMPVNASISYRQLNNKSDQLAALLRAKSVKPDTMVAILLERSLVMIAAIVGILKAGGAYLPIEPGYPGKRVTYMLDDSNTSLLITQKELVKKIRFKGETIDLINDVGYHSATGDLSPLNVPADAAYVIYTSGTTGDPKGAVIEHRNVVRLLFNDNNPFDFNGKDVWTMFHSYGFDFSVWEMYGSLLYGGKLIIIPKMIAMDPTSFLQVLTEEKVTVLNQTPTAFYSLTDEELKKPGELNLRYVIFGGEALKPVKLKEWKEKYPGTQLINMYGITETTVHVTYKEITDLEIKSNQSNIGKPIPTLTAYVMGSGLKLLPLGIPGELCVGGEGVCRGYLNRPELTSQKFTRNPYKRVERLYCSGDLVKLHQNGEMEYLGRIDHQVKIRGHRIELREIESQLLNHNDIKEAVVMIKTNPNGDKYICAYIITEMELTVSQLRSYLSESLPDYMLPSFFIKLDAIPLTPNGKIDRKALPEPEMNTETEYFPPRNNIEKKLVDIWAEVLGVNNDIFGIDANFFELGGHSLTAIKLLSKLQKEFNVKLKLVEIFKSPTIRALEDSLKQTGKEILVSIKQAEEKEYYSLSSAQRRLYILQQMEQGSTAYNMPQTVVLEGELEREELKEIFKRLIKRHDSFRTSFVLIDEQPVQKVYREVEFEIEYYQSLVNGHWSLGNEGEQTSNLEGTRELAPLPNEHKTRSPQSETNTIKNFIRPFDLAQTPLLRVGLIKIGETRHILMVDMHHIISDGTSHTILIRNFMDLYRGKKLSPLPFQYKDFSEWQNRDEQRKAIENQREYWLRKFEGEIPVLNLTTDYTRPKVQSFEGSNVGFEIRIDETKALNQLAKKQEATLYIVLLAAFNVLLAKLGNQEDIIIGTPVAGRRHEDLEHIIGMFVNTLAVRNFPGSGKKFNDFLGEVKESTLNAFENQDYPFEELVEQVSVKRDVSRNPLFDVMFVLQNMDFPKIEIPGLKLSPYEHKSRISKFDLELSAVEAEGKLSFTFDYCTKIFKQETIERFISYFKKIVTSILIAPGIKILDIEIISEQEKKQILFDFNDTDAEYPQDKTIHGLFEEQVERTPDHVALLGQNAGRGAQSEDEKRAALCAMRCALTYKELNEKSNHLAHLLQTKNVKPDIIVGIMVERSIEMIIGIMGILKSGGAYLPIDPEYPEERINYMLIDSSAKVLVTTSSLAEEGKKVRRFEGKKILLEEIFKNYNVSVLSVPSVANSHLRLPSAPATAVSSSTLTSTCQVGSANLAYVIYTSGTTGKPKGVMVKTRNAVNLVWGLKHKIYKKYNKSLRICLVSPFVFDASVKQIFATLLLGHSLYIIPEETRLDGSYLFQYYKKYKIDISDGAPTHLQLLLEGTDENDPENGVKEFIIGGEVLPQDIVSEFFNKFVKEVPRIINIYGPTECTVDSTLYEVTADNVERLNDNIPIGTPMPNCRVYILNRCKQLQPNGIAGELYIGGIGVGRGYLNNPELTKEKFDHDLWDYLDYHDEKDFLLKWASKNHRSPIYRTGDLARWLPDGNIEFLGRIDHQVKIRGFRIELGEIECHLLNYNEIKEAVVAAKEDKNGNIYLCAYIVSAREFTVSQLRSHLSKSLPDYMLPSFFIPLDKIPLTISGKVDRKRLPEPGAMNLNSDMVYIGPRNIIEKKLAEIWQKVLGINTISINDNFFEIGGDSIKTIQIVSRMKKAGYKLKMRDIFQNPQISSLVPLVKKIERIADQSVVSGAVPLTPIQKRFFENQIIDIHHYNQAVMFVLEEGFDEDAVKAVFTKIQEHHDALRMIYKKENGKVIQDNQGLDHPFSLQIFDYRNRKYPGNLIESRANEIQASIDLETGPLMKLGLFYLDDGCRLLIAIHHLVIDGVSWRILLEDIENLYQQYKKGKPLILPLKTDSFKVWSEKLSQYANNHQFLKERTYWAELESKQVQEIKKDFENEDNYMKDVESLSFSLEETETHLLLTKVNEAFGTGINDILLTALGLAIKRVYGNDRLLIALEGHGREEILEDIDVNRTVGWFTTLYPVILDFSYGKKYLSRQVKEVKENLRRLPNKGIGYSILKYLTGKEHKEEIDFRLNPQVIFNYLGQFDEDFESRSFKIAKESAGYTRSQNQRRDVDIEVSGIITNKRLIMSISYSRKQYKQETIRELLEHFKRELVHIITYCSSRREKELTPGDLTYTELSIEALDQLQRQHSYLIEDIYTLTPMQEGMLFYALFENEERATYFEQMSYRLQGELNGPLVEKSLNELFKRHDVLRTVFIYEGLNRPIQLVLKERNVDFYFEDLRESLPNPEKKEIFVREFREKDRQRSFDLSKDVLMRVAVHQLGDAEYQVTWSSHHILMDGWCIGILISEFSEIFTAFMENRDFQLPIVKPYRNYIQWLEKQGKNKTRNYWKIYLEGYEETAAVPRKENKGIFEGGFKAGSAYTRFEEEKTIALNKVAIRNRVTLNTVLQVAWGIVLGKYCSNQDIVFGVLISGRPPEIEGVESMIGCFINTIPVRITYDSKTKLNELIRCVQDRAIESEPHYYYSLAEIQAESSLKQNLLDHIIEFQNYPPAERIEGVGDKIRKNKTTETLKLSNVNVSEQSNYDFNVVIVPGEQISVGFSFNANVYDSQLVEQLGLNSIRVLEQIIENDTITIDEIALLSEEERKKILFEFNNNRADFPQDKTIYQFVEKHAEMTPDHVALVGQIPNPKSQIPNKEAPLGQVLNAFGGGGLTYRKLNERANQLANLLRSSGIVKDEPVGVLMERSQLMVESILAIWEAGGAYMPIDPGYPGERIDHMLTDSKAKVLITTSSLAKEVKRGFQTIFIDSYAFSNSSSSHLLNFSSSRPTDLAYIIYTSGSTGKPKGVMIEHIGMMNHIQAKINDLQLTEKSIVAQNATHTFDISIWQFFAALTLGGKTIIYPDELIMEPEQFLSRLVKDQITILEVVPSYLSVLLDDTAEQRTLRLSLQYLLVTGEEIKPHLVRKWFDKYPNIKMVNAYGPTEASDDITHYIMDKAPDMERIPIGKSLQNLDIYIVDNRMQLCPIGVKGEICVSGVGVGRGYIRDEEKTKQFFIGNPFISPITNESSSSFTNDQFSSPHSPHSPHSPYSTIYLTGDLGAWLPDGTIEFFGRKDYQVKIRGFRIELGEIENQLLNHPGIKEAVVIDREDKAGNKYLCAYIVAQREALDAWPMELREFLSGTLPDYMVPAHFVQLENIPLTSSGKIDRKALPEPEGGELTSKYVAPGNHVEKKLVEIWAEVLGKEKGVIGVNHSFFDLGGHSLKAIVLVSEIHKEFDVKLPLAELFRKPTIRELSHYIKEGIKYKYASIVPGEKKESYVLSSAQKRLYILQQMDLKSTAYNMPGVIPLRAEPDLKKLEETFILLIERHESLRTSFHLVDDQPVQKVHDVQDVEFKIEYYELIPSDNEQKIEITVPVKRSKERDHHFIVSEDQLRKYYGRAFDLSQAPLLKVGIVKTDDERYVLVIVMHHIISDWVSHGVLGRDFTALYDRKLLPPLRIQYKDFSVWQNSEKEKGNIKHQEAYWLKEFSDELPVLNLPLDYPRPLMQSFEGSSVTFVLTEREIRAIKDITIKTETTTYMFILSVYTILLYKLSGQEDIIVGTPVVGRRHADLHHIIGMFINTLSMRNYPSGKKTFKEFLIEVKERTLQAFENQEYQFEGLVEKLAVRRDTSRNPIFDVLFNMLNPPDNTRNTSKTVEQNSYSHEQRDRLEHREGPAKFDINLSAVEHEKQLVFHFEYCTKLFKKETIDRIIGYFKNIAASIMHTPDKKIADIQIISDAEREERILQFNKYLQMDSLIGTIQSKLNGSFQQYGNNIAIEYGAVKITYNELERKAAYISHWIIHNNIKKGSFIGIYTDDRIELISLILGILKTGCVFVPLDSRIPVKRIAAMIRLTNTQIVFTDTINNEKLQRFFNDFKNNLTTVIIDYSDYKTSASLLPGKGEIQYNAEDMIYIYFTSGTTGIPQAVLGKNKGLLHFINWEIDRFGVNEAFKFSQLINPGFDVFLRDIFIPLCSGAVICIPEEREIVFAREKITRWIETCNINFIHFVPSLFRLLISGNLKPNSMKSLKYITLSGEQIHIQDLKKWFEVQGETTQLVNIYGPTETTLAKASYFIKESDIYKQRIPIGQPIEGSSFIILDKYMNVCDQGIIGEIYIRTPYTSFGYCNTPGLNKERFIPNPFHDNNDGVDVIYRTGDLARELPDGNFEFIGRTDRQVKIRGIRIELKEIESLLLSHNEIRQAVVVAKEEPDHDIYLCAYLVSDKELPVSELREYLAVDLPVYMIPSYFVFFDKIPLTPNGKIDPRALPAPKITADEEYLPPRNTIEHKLTELWSEVLGIEKDIIGIDRNFFELGGHSLKATILTSRIHKEFNVKFPLARVFRTPTIRGLTQFINETEEIRFTSIEPVEKKEYYPLSSAQMRFYILQQIAVESTAYNMPIIIKLQGKLDRQRVQEAFTKMLNRHETLRTGFEVIDEEPAQRVYENVNLTIEYWEVPGAEVSGIIKNFVKSFKLAKPPLLRLEFIKSSDQEHILMFDMHHIITDLTSRGIFINDLLTLYTGKERPFLRLQYRDFSQWQKDQLESGELENQEEYWLNHFSGELPVLNMPNDYPRPLVQSFEGDTIGFHFERELHAKLKLIIEENGATLYMMLLALYNILLSKWTEQEDIIVGTPIAGRNHADLENIIGLLIETIAIRNYPEGDTTFEEFLGEVRRNTLRAYENQSYPFREIIKQVGNEHDRSRNPLFDAMLIVQNIETRIEPQGIEELRVDPYGGAGGSNKVAKVDITLTAVERENGIFFNLQYCTKLFKKKTMEVFIDSFKQITANVADNKIIKLNDIRISYDLGKAAADIYESPESEFEF